MNTYDVVIVGGGIIGGSIAFELSRRNLRVAVLDRQELMREASWAAAGMLSPAPDCPAAIPLVPLGRASLAMYPQFIAEVEEASEIRTGYRTDGTLEALVPRRRGTRTEHAGGAPSWPGPGLRTAAPRRSARDGACARTRCARCRVSSRRSLREQPNSDRCSARRRGSCRRGEAPRRGSDLACLRRE